jgi:exopolysaccharide biosynthesis predicted pyruvyltransferase EpsI
MPAIPTRCSTVVVETWGRFILTRDSRDSQPAVAKNCGNPAVLAATAEDYVRMASCYRVVHTDCLHFAIAAMIAGREARLYANSHFKNEAMYHLWLKGRRCQWGGKLAVAN